MANAKLVIIVALRIFAIVMAVNAKRIPSFAGPYRITVRHANNETDEYKSKGLIWARLYFTSPKPNQMQYTWGKFYCDHPITDAMGGEVRLSKWSNNQWKRNAFVFKFQRQGCSALLNHAKSMVDLVYEPHERKCPLPKVGLREIKNQTFEAIFPHFPILPYARYLFTMVVFRNGNGNGNEVIGVFVVDGNAVPKM